MASSSRCLRLLEHGQPLHLISIRPQRLPSKPFFLRTYADQNYSPQHPLHPRNIKRAPLEDRARLATQDSPELSSDPKAFSAFTEIVSQMDAEMPAEQIEAEDYEDPVLQDMPPREIQIDPSYRLALRRRKPDQEPDKEVLEEIDEFRMDDVPQTAHAELEQRREIRELQRVVAWDMPLLWNHRKEFKEPNEAEQPLRWRYTTYMGEEHPGARKTVVDFRPSNIPGLTSRQVTKMIKLLGPRYDPLADRAKMSCHRFPTTAQNKRFVGDMVEKLIAEAKNSKDMFEDVPFDFRANRHVEKRRRERALRQGFPESWKMTEQRREMLSKKRAEAESEERQKAIAGQVVNGMKVLEEAVVGGQIRAREPVMARARR